MTMVLWITDTLKGLGLTALFGSPLIVGLVKIIEWAGEEAFIYYCTLFVIVFILFIMILYPNFIAPLFNKFTPLNANGDNEREAELVKQIDLIAEKVKFPMDQIYVIDGSKRSEHSNAYFFGVFSKKMLVLFDTILKKLDNDDIIGVVCHEMGHWYHWHNVILKGAAFTQVFCYLSLSKIFIFTDKLYTDFGFEKKELVMGIFLFGLFLTPIEMAMSITMNYIVRTCEYQADRFSLRFDQGEQLITALVKLHKDNLADLDPHPLYAT